MSRRVNRREGAEYIGIKEPTFKKLEREGKGPPVIRIGRRRIYDTADLDIYLAAHRHVAQEQPPAAASTTDAGPQFGSLQEPPKKREQPGNGNVAQEQPRGVTKRKARAGPEAKSPRRVVSKGTRPG